MLTRTVWPLPYRSYVSRVHKALRSMSVSAVYIRVKTDWIAKLEISVTWRAL